MKTPTARRLFALVAIVLLAGACSRGQTRDEVIADLTEDGTMTEEQAICTVDRIEAELGIQTEDIVNDSDLSAEQRSQIGTITAECLFGTSSADATDGDDAATATTAAPATTAPATSEAPASSVPPRPGGDVPPPPGDDAELDALWIACADGADDACDELYWSSPIDSEYEAFGADCGGRESGCGQGGTVSLVESPGTNPALEPYWDQCAEGSAMACDQLFLAAESNDEYYDFGLSCGDREITDCASLLGDDGEPPILANWSPDTPPPGDDADFDALWVECGEGSADACATIFAESPVASEYERYGYTCGGRAIANCYALFGQDPPEGGIGTGDADPLLDSADRFDPTDPPPGTDPAMDALWVACAGGDGQACDDLFWQSDVDSDYEAFGFSCGGRQVTDCVELLG